MTTPNDNSPDNNLRDNVSLVTQIKSFRSLIEYFYRDIDIEPPTKKEIIFEDGVRKFEEGVRKLFEEWNNKNSVVKNVMDDKTTFHEEYLKLFGEYNSWKLFLPYIPPLALI